MCLRLCFLYSSFPLGFVDWTGGMDKGTRGPGDMDIAYIVNLHQFTSIYVNYDTFACPKFQGRALSRKKKRLRHAALVTKKVHIVK